MDRPTPADTRRQSLETMAQTFRDRKAACYHPLDQDDA